MSTTIKVALVTLPLWFAWVALITIAFEPTQNVIVLGAPGAVTQAPVSLLDSRGGVLHLRGTQPGFVRELYASGAWLVLPATNGGCRGRWRQIDRPLMRNKST